MRFKECPICLEKIYIKKKKLKCNHVFHKTCIDKMITTFNKRFCPICMAHIMTSPEMKLLSITSPDCIDHFYTFHKSEVDVDEVISEAIKKGNDNLILYLLNKADLNKIFPYLIDTQNIDLVKLFLTTNKINFHSTINGQSLIERAFLTKNSELINIILDHCGYNKDKPMVASAPYVY